MSYANTANRPNPAAMLGALGVPAAFGAVLVIGLAVKVIIPPKVDNPKGVIITPTIPDPPPPPVDKVEQSSQTTQPRDTQQPFVAPPPPSDFGFNTGPNNPITTFPAGGTGPIGPIEVPGPVVQPTLPDPIAAAPANNPGNWISDSDYKTPWIRREYSGVAGFALTIDAKGKVSDCTITSSTGHAALDQATCKLIQRRARFEPAKDSYGNAIAGSYSNSVNWRLPE